MAKRTYSRLNLMRLQVRKDFNAIVDAINRKSKNGNVELIHIESEMKDLRKSIGELCMLHEDGNNRFSNVLLDFTKKPLSKQDLDILSELYEITISI